MQIAVFKGEAGIYVIIAFKYFTHHITATHPAAEHLKEENFWLAFSIQQWSYFIKGIRLNRSRREHFYVMLCKAHLLLCSFLRTGKGESGDLSIQHCLLPKDQLWFWLLLQNPELSLALSWDFLIGIWELYFLKWNSLYPLNAFFTFLQTHMVFNLRLTALRYLNLARRKLNAWIK